MRRRLHPQDWALRDYDVRYDERFEDIDSEEYEDLQGVALDSNSFAARDARARGFVSDELYFDGYDIGQNRITRVPTYEQIQYTDEIDSDELEYRDRTALIHHLPAKDRQDVLVQSAMERISKARTKGKTNVSLSVEEMEALERRNSQQPEPTPTLASPPATPVKGVKGKTSSRSSSSTSLAAQKTRKRGNSFFGTSSPATPKSGSKPKVNRKSSAEQAVPMQLSQVPPGVVLQGPDGTPFYAPIGYYAPPSPEYLRSPKSSSRSTSKHSRRESTPPERSEAYTQQFSPRYYAAPAVRPPSAGSRNAHPDDPDAYVVRNRSSSNAQHHLSSAEDNAKIASSVPAAHERRHVSNPADVRYATLRRIPPSSPLAARAVPARRSRRR